MAGTVSEDRTDLTGHNSFHVAARARRILRLEHPDQLAGFSFDRGRDLILGDGSNVLLVGDVPGTALLNRLPGRAILRAEGSRAIVRVGAGEDWHQVVRWTLAQGLSGLENLSLIPGRCGAAPMQNIGAYGVELADHLQTVEAWDWQRRKMVRFDHADCGFAYRDSRFKSVTPHRYLITALELTLDRQFQPRLDYAGLRESLEEAGVEHPTARDVSDAVIRLRRRKLPDPDVIGNAGSFFKNPVIDRNTADTMSREWPGLPLFPAPDGAVKVSAAWMIERCGWKGRRIGDAGVSERHALVLVNHGNATGAALRDLADRVRDDVEARFRVRLEAEPRIVDLQGRQAPPTTPRPPTRS
jgi:UDP-N-acetylmuramate dehydrogenase